METTISRLFILLCLILGINSCESSEDVGGSKDGSGKGGSMARFTIANNYLYTVDNHKLNVFSITSADSPVFEKSITAGFNIETIFTNKNSLYLGSEWGMYIFDISDPANPKSLSYYQHIYSCDPVVANDSLAYVTLRTESFCGRSTNELQVVDIKNPANPVFLSRLSMTKPYGLGIDGKNLFVCDDGLKVYSLSDPVHPSLNKHFKIPAFDVIPDENLLMVLATDGLYQYSYQNDTISFLSHLPNN